MTERKPFATLNPSCPFKIYSMSQKCEHFYRLHKETPEHFRPGDLAINHKSAQTSQSFLPVPCKRSFAVPIPFGFQLSAFSCWVTPLRFSSSGTINSMRFRAASSISAQYCLKHTQLSQLLFIMLWYSESKKHPADPKGKAGCYVYQYLSEEPNARAMP